MLSFKEESGISVCALSMDRVTPASLVETSTATVRKSVGLASSIKSVLYFFIVLGLTLSLPTVVLAQVTSPGFGNMGPDGSNFEYSLEDMRPPLMETPALPDLNKEDLLAQSLK
ncbi:MAG: hypothetical protein NTY13_04410 [Chlamydiae bacterium]|nr:hypothetical protein [Chlamydiota bacterium]